MTPQTLELAQHSCSRLKLQTKWTGQQIHKESTKSPQNQLPQRDNAIFNLEEKILKPETKKSQQRQSSRRRNQPRKEYNFFNP